MSACRRVDPSVLGDFHCSRDSVMEKLKTLCDAAKDGTQKIYRTKEDQGGNCTRHRRKGTTLPFWVAVRVSTTKLLSFTFVPVVRRLPIKNEVREKKGSPARTSNEHLAGSKEREAEDTMSEDGVFKAEVVYIGADSEEGAARGRWAQLAKDETAYRQEAQSQLKLPTVHMTQGQPTSLPISAPSENKVHLFHNTAHILTPAALEITQNNDQSNLLSNQVPEKRERRTLVSASQVAHFTELFATPASSKESVLSEDCSALHALSSEGSPVSLSRTVSPCSSIRSGAFSPSVIRVKRHSLASGSSLLQKLPSCLSLASESPSPSPCPLSPSMGRAWHRPPPTQLSLLTAILRKGRLPILSPTLQRAYSPCWPITAASLSSCNACLAASKLGSLYQGVSGAQCQSAMEEPKMDPNHTQWPVSETLKCLTPPPSPDLTEVTTIDPHVRSLSQSAKLAPVKHSTEPSQRVTSPIFKSHTASPICPQSVTNFSQPINTEGTLSQASNPVLSSSFSRLRSMSPKTGSLTCCSKGDFPALSPVPKVTFSSVPRCKEVICPSSLQNGIKGPQAAERPYSRSPACQLSPPPRASSFSPSPCTSPHFHRSPSPRPNSPSSTPECLTLSPSPVPSNRDLSPSPSLSVSSTPSPIPKSGADRAGKKRKSQLYKIKSSYKALAAIPTNTLLLEQQAIDDEVEKEGSPVDSTDKDSVLETHVEMCSPAQLRQQSEELYAAIDQVLQDPLPMRRSQSAPLSLMTSMETEAPKRFTSLPRSAGRETKYATFHLQTPGSAERSLTRPGVIRPVTVIQKLTEEEEEEEYHPNPFQQYLEEMPDDQQHELASRHMGSSAKAAGGCRSPGSPRPRGEETPPKEVPLLLITEKEQSSSPSVTDGSSKSGPSSFNSGQVKMEVHETHI
ncbi:muscular LMNA-interacting protein isoform X2 [Megalops cyprinoides]|uniref:muscular LMNA-interacting protein isoform X2 n=1 Tax=Megalops cyprinoides TaxID=118141 RepID=UPI001864AC41|nr:muscular LMNA-interacting protein isoform X2 [Megalops cyprinoides]